MHFWFKSQSGDPEQGREYMRELLTPEEFPRGGFEQTFGHEDRRTGTAIESNFWTFSTPLDMKNCVTRCFKYFLISLDFGSKIFTGDWVDCDPSVIPLRKVGWFLKFNFFRECESFGKSWTSDKQDSVVHESSEAKVLLGCRLRRLHQKGGAAGAPLYHDPPHRPGAHPAESPHGRGAGELVCVCVYVCVCVCVCVCVFVCVCACVCVCVAGALQR